jgi:prepilin-type N-terminal cleavage/methylation domain-containing protein
VKHVQNKVLKTNTKIILETDTKTHSKQNFKAQHLQNKLLTHNSKAFTLAEVLIALVVIGVIAAITVPNIIQSTKKKELHSAFLKTYSELNQVAHRFKNDNYISIPEYDVAKGLNSTINEIMKYYQTTNSNLAPMQGTANANGEYIAYYDIHTMNGAKYSGGANSAGKNSSFLCDDSSFKSNLSGALFLFNNVPNANENGPVICVDINGRKGPNRYGYDYFLFIFTVDGNVIPMGQNHKNNTSSYCTAGNGWCGNFSNVGSQYCDKTSNNIAFNTSCANYALTNKHPNNPNKTYWEDYI